MLPRLLRRGANPVADLGHAAVQLALVVRDVTPDVWRCIRSYRSR